MYIMLIILKITLLESLSILTCMHALMQIYNNIIKLNETYIHFFLIYRISAMHSHIHISIFLKICVCV